MRLLCFGAWLTWICLTIKLLVSSPLVSAFASAFLSSESRNSADLTGQRALLTPNCLPVHHCPSNQYDVLVCILAHGYTVTIKNDGVFHVPWAVRPVLPAYLLIGTASAWFLTFSR